jgi:hypothetical protein
MQTLTNIDLKKVADETKRVFEKAYDRCLYFKISGDLYAIVTNKINFPVWNVTSDVLEFIRNSVYNRL